MMRYLIIGFLVLVVGNTMIAQPCDNDTNYPTLETNAPINHDTVPISYQSYAGDYAVVGGLVAQETYTFTSAVAGDVITIREVESDTVIIYGVAPITFSPVIDMDVEVHFNLENCGIEAIGRHTQVIHVPPVITNYVGINNQDPQSTLDINGKLTLADDEATPDVGMIRYNAETQDFEGYDGIKWRSFTQGNGDWGKLKTPSVVSEHKLYAPDGMEGDRYGQKIDIDASSVAVVVPERQVGENLKQGAVYMYSRSGADILFEQTITDPNGESLEKFGSGGVQLDGDQLIIASPFSNSGDANGRAHIYAKQNGEWVLEVALDGGNQENYSFGRTVTIEGDYAAIKSYGQNDNPNKVMIYKKTDDTWDLHQSIVDEFDSNLFGLAILLKDSKLYIGDPTYDQNANGGGRVLIFSIDAGGDFVLSTEILNLDILSYPDDQFGYSLDVDGDKLVVGMPGFTYDNVPDCGRVVIFQLIDDDYNYHHIFYEDTPTGDREFGKIVKMENGQLIIGNSSSEPYRKVDVYIQNEIGWTTEAELTSDANNDYDYFGVDIAISNGMIIVGASHSEINGNNIQGMVHVFVK